MNDMSDIFLKNSLYEYKFILFFHMKLEGLKLIFIEKIHLKKYWVYFFMFLFNLCIFCNTDNIKLD